MAIRPRQDPAENSPGAASYRVVRDALARLDRWLIKPSASIIHQQERRQASLLSGLLLCVLVLATVWGLTWEIVNTRRHGPTMDTLITVVAVVLLGALYAFSRTAHFRPVARLTVVMISAATFLTAIPDHDPSDANMLIYLLLPVLISSIILSARATALLIAVQTVLLVLFPFVFPESHAGTAWIGYITFFSLMLLASVRYWRLLEDDRRTDLEASETRYRVLFDGIDDTVLVHALDGRILEANAAACRRLGYSRAELLAMTLADLEAPDFAAGFAERMVRQRAEGALHVVDGTHLARNGRRIHIDATNRLITFQNQPAVLAVCHDISERARAEAVLQDAETRTRAMLVAFPDLIFRMSHEGIFLDYQADESIPLYTPPETFVGRRVEDVMPPEVAQAALARIHRAIDTNSPQTSEYDLSTESGELRRFEARSVPIDHTEVLTVVRDITEITRAQARLRASEAEYRSLFEDSPISMLEEDYSAVRDHIARLRAGGVTDLAGYLAAHPAVVADMASEVRIVNANRAALALYGAPTPEALMARHSTVFSPEKDDSFRAKLVAFDDGVRHFQTEAQHYTLTGEAIAAITTVSFAPGYEASWGKVFVSVVDVTRLKQAEQAEREQRALSDALREVAAAINTTLELDHVLDRILVNIERVVSHDAANVMLVEDDRLVMVRARGYERFGDTAWIHNVRLGLGDLPHTARLLETGMGYVISDTRAEPEWNTLEPTAWVRSHMAVAIRAEGRVLGVMKVDSSQPHAFTESHREALEVFADQAATAIHNARLYAEVRAHSSVLEQRVVERTADLSVRNAVSETLSSSLDMAEMLNGVLRTTVEQLGVTGGAIYLLTEDATALEMIAHSGVAPDILNLVTGIAPGQPDFDRLHGLAAAPGEPQPDITARTGISAALSVPIWQQEQVQGVIALVHDQPRPWRSDETRMVDAIGRQIGMALSNARLYADALRDEARLRTILQSMADGMLVFDAEGALILINPAAEALFAFYPARLGGARRAAALLWAWLRAQESESVEFVMPVSPLGTARDRLSPGDDDCPLPTCPRRAGSDLAWPCWLNVDGPSPEELRTCSLFQRIARRSIQAQSAQVRPPGSGLQGTVIALHDVTYFRELDELKGRFVSTVSHELRTPLSAMLLQVSTLLKYYDRFGESERRSMIAEMQQQAYVLRELIEDILELSRFDAHRAMPQKQWFDLAAHCRDVVESLSLAITEKNLYCEVIGIDEARYVLGDPNQLSRVVRNLLSNAIKYTPSQGRVTLRLDQRGANIRLAVTDTGIGIAPEKQLYVFDRFFRTDEASEMASGTGLGLSITREIVDLHGGQIELDSVPGQGSTFTVLLPVTPGD